MYGRPATPGLGAEAKAASHLTIGTLNPAAVPLSHPGCVVSALPVHDQHSNDLYRLLEQHLLSKESLCAYITPILDSKIAQLLLIGPSHWQAAHRHLVPPFPIFNRSPLFRAPAVRDSTKEGQKDNKNNKNNKIKQNSWPIVS
ncbi:hypothetical protein IF1G_07674 [Cordyceps javanica]|uniref:Uncharacterized protein n=1 Tax=Cordyceps javanica TaxID=43265 RepID=A0A545UWU6_9HYPO|nr:hypothetical protein IF1G_07674 [Cordyceps javanica]